MKIWQKLFLAAAVLVAVAAEDAHEEGSACDWDVEQRLTDNDKERRIRNKTNQCFMSHIDEAKLQALTELPPLEAYQEVIGGLCSHSQEITTCIAGARRSLANCKAKNLTETFVIFTETVEHVFTAGCEQGGGNLALLFRGVILMYKRPETLKPLRRCLYKAYPSISNYVEKDLDIASQSYLLYKACEDAKRCIQHIDDEAYKAAAQWLNDELHSGMKCKHPEEDRSVLCSEVDPNKVTTSSICKMSPYSQPDLYEHLEATADHCYLQRSLSFDEHFPENMTDLDWLKERYQYHCQTHREMPQCLVMVSSIAEHCLPVNEEKQFALEMQFLEDYMSRLCVEDGVFLSTVMQQVYKNVPAHGNAFTVCETLLENKADEETSSNKGRRAYHYFQAYKKCVVGKLHESSDIAAALETAFNDVLKEMKCINPENDTVVNCETIYQEQ